MSSLVSYFSRESNGIELLQNSSPVLSHKIVEECLNIVAGGCWNVPLLVLDEFGHMETLVVVRNDVGQLVEGLGVLVLLVSYTCIQPDL